ncbi:MAG: hypothetical protein FWH15_08985 [Betaproteobacteria bacterium]|nr:hypothetical protein [Betaproteobacteria bacterium]
MDQFAEFACEQKLVTIYRDDIDPNSIQGFVLGYSNDLVLIQDASDFQLDGLMVLRTADITDIRCNTTDEFYKQLLIDEQLFQKVSFGSSFDRQYRLMILEDESAEPQQFLIGTVEKITTQSVWLLYFSSVGIWDHKPTRLLFRDITKCEVATNYLNVYERHFDRHMSQPLGQHGDCLS